MRSYPVILKESASEKVTNIFEHYVIIINIHVRRYVQLTILYHNYSHCDVARNFIWLRLDEL
jgi:hypothetical protein